MLSVTAYTLRQKSRLAISLAWVGGFVDAVGFAVLAGVFTSNMTGNTALFGTRVAAGDWTLAWRAGFVIAMFFLGAVLSGIITTTGPRRGIKSIYALALSIEMAMLSGFMILCGQLGVTTDDAGFFPYALVGLAAMAMGLQNATITQIAGAVVRTTHVTGVVTDLGLESVQFVYWFRDKTHGQLRHRLRKAFALSARHPSMQRLFLLASIWGSFTVGAILGVFGFRHLSSGCLIAPICFLAFMVTLDYLRPIAEVSQVDHRRHDQELNRFGIDPGLLPPTVGVYRIRGGTGRKRRAPDLGRLVERVAPEFKVLLLMIADGIDLDDNNLAGFCAAIRNVHSQSETRIVVCCLDSRIFCQVRASAAGEEVGEANVCPDPEFAVARALELSSIATERRDSLSVA